MPDIIVVRPLHEDAGAGDYPFLFRKFLKLRGGEIDESPGPSFVNFQMRLSNWYAIILHPVFFFHFSFLLAVDLEHEELFSY